MDKNDVNKISQAVDGENPNEQEMPSIELQIQGFKSKF
jgi:hypothetical protein